MGRRELPTLVSVRAALTNFKCDKEKAVVAGQQELADRRDRAMAIRVCGAGLVNPDRRERGT